MKGNNKDTKVRQNGGADRRPSYPADPRVMQASTATKIWVKVAMAIAYFLCVSVASFILVIYYVFAWNPKNNTTTTGTNGTECSQSV